MQKVGGTLHPVPPGSYVYDLAILWDLLKTKKVEQFIEN